MRYASTSVSQRHFATHFYDQELKSDCTNLIDVSQKLIEKSGFSPWSCSHLLQIQTMAVICGSTLHELGLHARQIYLLKFPCDNPKAVEQKYFESPWTTKQERGKNWTKDDIKMFTSLIPSYCYLCFTKIIDQTKSYRDKVDFHKIRMLHCEQCLWQNNVVGLYWASWDLQIACPLWQRAQWIESITVLCSYRQDSPVWHRCEARQESMVCKKAHIQRSTVINLSKLKISKLKLFLLKSR